MFQELAVCRLSPVAPSYRNPVAAIKRRRLLFFRAIMPCTASCAQFRLAKRLLHAAKWHPHQGVDYACNTARVGHPGGGHSFPSVSPRTRQRQGSGWPPQSMNPPRLFQCPKQILSRPCEGLSDLAIAMFLNGQQQHFGYLIPLVMRDILVFQCLVGRERRICSVLLRWTSICPRHKARAQSSAPPPARLAARRSS